MSDINIHSTEFLTSLRGHIAEKLTVPGLTLKWIAMYRAWLAVIDRMVAALTPKQ